MGEVTNISWTGKTWNPWQGCTKVSPGCAHCYMYRDKVKYGQDPTDVHRSSDATFYKPLHWKEADKVFTCSWSDWFHETADPWRDEAWAVIKRTPHLTYQILTKRPERILEHLPADWGDGYPNVWLGTSVENQHFADIRIPLLNQVPAMVRFLSCEPLLGPVDLWSPRYAWPMGGSGLGGAFAWGKGIDWVIVGGESGPMFRPMDLEWARDIRDDCEAAGVAFFFKQSSGLRSETGTTLDGKTYHKFPTVKNLAGGVK